MRQKPTLALVAILALVMMAAAARAVADDAFIRGYAIAVLQREFEIAPDAVTVEDGVVTVRADLPESARHRLTAVLTKVDGVRDVVIVEANTRPPGVVWFPRSALFSPLIADPRWPRFSVAYQYYIDDDQLEHVANVTFGESFPLLQYNPNIGGSWQLGVQGGVFAIFNLAAPSADLTNADYLGAIPVSFATGNFSALGRILHQSSHLGDEFLLNNPVRRVNLSYEAIDLLLSYELPAGFRTYAGGGYIFRVEPSELKPWLLQGGVEYVGQTIDIGLGMKPIAAVDVKINEEGGWAPSVSPRVGVELGKLRGRGRSAQILLEYFNGKSPNGQFYQRDIQYLGLGVQLHL